LKSLSGEGIFVSPEHAPPDYIDYADQDSATDDGDGFDFDNSIEGVAYVHPCNYGHHKSDQTLDLYNELYAREVLGSEIGRRLIQQHLPTPTLSSTPMEVDQVQNDNSKKLVNDTFNYILGSLKGLSIGGGTNLRQIDDALSVSTSVQELLEVLKDRHLEMEKKKRPLDLVPQNELVADNTHDEKKQRTTDTKQGTAVKEDDISTSVPMEEDSDVSVVEDASQTVEFEFENTTGNEQAEKMSNEQVVVPITELEEDSRVRLTHGPKKDRVWIVKSIDQALYRAMIQDEVDGETIYASIKLIRRISSVPQNEFVADDNKYQDADIKEDSISTSVPTEEDSDVESVDEDTSQDEEFEFENTSGNTSNTSVKEDGPEKYPPSMSSMATLQDEDGLAPMSSTTTRLGISSKGDGGEEDSLSVRLRKYLSPSYQAEKQAEERNSCPLYNDQDADDEADDTSTTSQHMQSPSRHNKDDESKTSSSSSSHEGSISKHTELRKGRWSVSTYYMICGILHTLFTQPPTSIYSLLIGLYSHTHTARRGRICNTIHKLLLLWSTRPSRG